MASLLSLVVNGVTRLNNDTHGKNVYADKHITNGGSNLQFVKGDGSLDNTLYAKSSDLSNYLPLAGGWMDTGAQIYFKGLNQSTSVWGSIGYRAKSGNGSNAMHNVTSPNNTGALYITTNGYDSANDYGGLAIDNDGVTAFGAGDSGSVFRVINEDNVGDGAQFYVTKASGAVVKKSLTASNFVSNEATGTQPYACTSTTLNTNLNADYLDGMHESSFVRWGGYDGTFGTHCPADTVKSKFTAATMPNGNLLAYDTSGNEYTLLMTCRPDILHGTALKWGYPDRYIRILRFTNGTAATTDWEKIAAGYADSAGNADTLDDKHANELFTSLANSGNDLSITIGGTTKTLTLAYASVSGSCTGNAASATKLQTSRKLWSQPFDGTADVNGQIDIIISKQNSSTIVPTSSAIMLGSNGAGHTGYHAGIAFNALRYNPHTNHIHAWVGLGPYTTTTSAECYPLVFATNGSTTTGDAPTEKMRITPSGDVGIGDTNPAYKLEVAGTICGKAIYANRDASTTAGGVSLYSNSDPMTYGIAFRGTGTYGTHGYVTATNDWATYLTMNDSTTRGWIFRRGSTNVASIAGSGNMAINENLEFSNGAHIATNRTSDYHYSTLSFSIGNNSKNIGMYSGPEGEAGGIVVSPDGCLIYNSSDSGFNLDIHDKDLGGDLTVETTRTFAILQSTYYAWSRGGFQKSGSSDDYLLLGGGGHKAVSYFAPAHDHPYLPLAGGYMDTDAQIYFKGSGSSTSVYGLLGFRSSTPSGLTMHYTGAQTKALFLCVNGYQSATDNGGIAIDNDCVTAFGAGDNGAVFRVINEDNVNDGSQFYVTKASGAVAKYSMTASNFVSNVAIGTQPYACTSTTLNTNLNADLLDGLHSSAFKQTWETYAGKEYIGWISIIKWTVSTAGHFSPHPFKLSIYRSYNSPASESYTLQINAGWNSATIMQINGNAGNRIIEQFRIARNSASTEYRLEYYVNTSYTTYKNTCYCVIDSYTSFGGSLINETSSGMSDSLCSISTSSGKIVGNLAGTADVASVARSLASDGTHIMYAQNNDEVNFGGSYAGSTIYFGYRAAGSKPVPSAFVFGTSAGTATLKGGGFIKNGSSNDYVLLGGGGHKALTDFSMAHSHPYLPSAQVSIEQNANDDWIHEYALNNVRAHVHNTAGLEWQYLIGISTGKTYGSILRTSYGNGTPRLQIKGINGGSWTAWREVSYDGHTHSQYLTALPSHTHTKSEITDFAHTHTKSEITDFAHTHTSITDSTMTVYSHYSNEVNFGGTNTSSTIYFGYRAMDSKPIPTSFVFGSSTGTATVTSSGFKKTGSSDSYVLLGAGGHKALSDFSMAHSHPYLPLAGGTMTGTIVTPGNDTVVIKPAKNNYDQIGGEGIAFWKIYATNFYGTFHGNATSATNATYATYLSVHDVRSATRAPSYFTNRNVTAWFNNTGTPTSDWYSGLHVKGWDNSGSSGYCSWEIASYSSTGTSTYSYPLWYRSGNNGSWSSWYRVVTTGQTSGNAGHYGWPVYLSSGQITECSFGVLWAGYIYRTSLSETAWYASSSYSPKRYNASGASNTVSVTVTVNGSSTSNPGLMTLKLSTGFAYVAFATTNRIYNSSTAHFYPNTDPATGRSAGMGDYWINCSGSTVYIKKFKQQNGNNDKWADTDLITTTTSDGNKPPMSFYLIIFGTFYAP